MADTITIRNLENHEVFTFDKPVWNLRYNSTTMLFPCNDFRFDEWMDNVCGRPLALAQSLFPELDENYTFSTFAEARYFLSWLHTEAHPAYLRMTHAS